MCAKAKPSYTRLSHALFSHAETLRLNFYKFSFMFCCICENYVNATVNAFRHYFEILK